MSKMLLLFISCCVWFPPGDQAAAGLRSTEKWPDAHKNEEV
jgi:hypothetical protein